MHTPRMDNLKMRGEQLFTKRAPILTLWQEIADNFYPERADFTNIRNIGDDMARHLITSYPAIARRDLGNSIGSMLRPSAKEWFHAGTNHPDREDTEAKQWLQWAGGLQKNAMYDRKAQFARATKEGDHDFAAFGQCVISAEINFKTNTLLYRSWHLRDVAWMENESGEITTIYRKFKPSCIALRSMFKNIHKKVIKKLEKEPYHEVNCWHIIVPAEEYKSVPGAREIKEPFVAIFLDVDNDFEMEAVGVHVNPYIIPRWATVAGSQYAHSPATIVGLGDARLIQAVTAVILEAGEKSTNPPMLAVQEAIRGDVSIFAGGITWVDSDYDERLGEVLRPLTQDRSGFSFGLEVQGDIREQLANAFYLNKLSLPPAGGPDMTAYETGQRVQEYIRNALPLFEPMEADYNGRLCEVTFDLLMHAGAFGDARSIPKSIQGSDIRFHFESPLHDASEKAKAGQFMEAQEVLAGAAQVDPTAALLINTKKATRDVLEAVAPAEWLHTEAEVEKKEIQQAQQQEAAQKMEQMQQASEIAKNVGMDKMPEEQAV